MVRTTTDDATETIDRTRACDRAVDAVEPGDTIEVVVEPFDVDGTLTIRAEAHESWGRGSNHRIDTPDGDAHLLKQMVGGGFRIDGLVCADDPLRGDVVSIRTVVFED